jgi:hypothetical protein
MPTPDLVQRADLIVVGTAAVEGGKMVVRVSEVLKGEDTDPVVLSGRYVGPFNKLVIKPGDEGIYSLAKYKDGYRPFDWECFKSAKHVKAVRAAIGMVRDPGPFLDDENFSEDLDLIYVLGEKFGQLSIVSEEIPSLNTSWTACRVYTTLPWEDKRLVTVRFATDANRGNRVRVTSEEPQCALSAWLKYRQLVSYKWPTARDSLPPRFAVTFDARRPQCVGSATVDEALSYLRDRLTSADSEVVLAALLALAKMRDLDACPLVLPLLEHKDERVVVNAIDFLGSSRCRQATKPLCSLLHAKAPHYPEDHAVANAAARSLQRIGGPTTLPHLERAACHGVEWAMSAVGAIGTEESFEILLKGLESNPPRCASIDYALYGLVRRSNKAVESWMYDEKTTTHATQIARIPKWRAWWNVHKKDFTVIKSYEEEVLERIQVD